MKIYEFDQNNTGGSFDVDDKLCHRLYIEAESYEEAVSKAEEMGVYFNGCDEGLDCDCCGDRWYSPNEVQLKEGYRVSSYRKNSKADAMEEIVGKYGEYSSDITYMSESRYMKNSYEFKIKFTDIEGYIQYMVDEYGWTSPDARLFYNDGTVKEFYKS